VEELRASRAGLAEAERVAGIGSFERDLVTGVVSVSDGLLAIYGRSADTFNVSLDSRLQHVHPDDEARVRETIERAIAERSSYIVEFRTIRKDGRVRDVRAHADVMVDTTGQPTRVVGVAEDITDAKLTKEALRSTSAELAHHANELQQLALASANEQPAIPYAPLSARQLEIMQLVAQGLTNAAIGERLQLTEGTIKWHIRQILTKTNSRNRAEAIAHVLGTPT
jgi:PAS domain S-box-containing protein